MSTPTTRQHDRHHRLRHWLLQDTEQVPTPAMGTVQPASAIETTPGSPAPEESGHRQSWWKVMCLTGVDYFSTLGYQPGIAALAAGILSPLATIVLVLLTLFGALPVYRRVASESFRGEGSIAMLERLLPAWLGKLFVLALLGFAATDFMITMTLSAADATAHLVENPYVPESWGGHTLLITLLLLTALAAVFLRGFSEAIGIAVLLVGVYLLLNLVVVIVGLVEVITAPVVVTDWTSALTTSYASPWMMVGIALLVFPKLALGLSGFETGVAVMPQIRGDADDRPDHPKGRIRGTRRLLTTAAIIMSAFLITSSLITTFLIPQQEFQSGGQANGRALAYLAHEHLGAAFGTIYDVSTITILWFAGASAMAGLLNLVPRYLPRYGMAPEWTRAVRPLVLVFAFVAFFITWIFDADVDAQSGAYATGVLVLMTSASIAVTLSARRRRHRASTIGFALIAAVFVYTTVVNVIERPDGVRIASLFILGIVVISLISRVRRSFELRVTSISLDATASGFFTGLSGREVRLVAHDPDRPDAQSLGAKERQQRAENHIPAEDPIVFLEVTVIDASDFTTHLDVRGCLRNGRRVLEVVSPVVPNSIAAILLHLRDAYGVRPNVYFEWTEGNPVTNLLRFLFLGEGEFAPVTREVLRRAEPDRSRRPKVHVG
ncbi:amino acid permease [Nakamurella flava]|uniref:amino acid permease n=1 Tax=Nakamurella flava TaxID=2576308 RepID=UPI00197BA911|nr:amino acid permease [Nakamurella flava]